MRADIKQKMMHRRSFVVNAPLEKSLIQLFRFATLVLLDNTNITMQLIMQHAPTVQQGKNTQQYTPSAKHVLVASINMKMLDHLQSAVHVPEVEML